IGVADKLLANEFDARLETEKAKGLLEESEKNYRQLFKSNPSPMWVYDLETLQFLDVNEAAINNYGYSLAEFLSMTIKDIRPAADVPKLVANVESAQKGLEYSSDWRHLKKDGSVIYVDIR